MGHLLPANQLARVDLVDRHLSQADGSPACPLSCVPHHNERTHGRAE
jgi:hypothetical protein